MGLSLSVRGVAYSVDWAHLKQEVKLRFGEVDVIVSIENFWKAHSGDLVLGGLHLDRVAHRVGAPMDLPAIDIVAGEGQLAC